MKIELHARRTQHNPTVGVVFSYEEEQAAIVAGKALAVAMLLDTEMGGALLRSLGTEIQRLDAAYEWTNQHSEGDRLQQLEAALRAWHAVRQAMVINAMDGAGVWANITSVDTPPTT